MSGRIWRAPPAQPKQSGAVQRLVDRGKRWAAAQTGCSTCNKVRGVAAVMIDRIAHKR